MKPNGEQIPLYAEVGRFFSPDGSFDESFFRESLEEYFTALKRQYGIEDNSGRDAISKWFSSYLNDIMEYLDEKQISFTSYDFLTIAVDEYEKMGITGVFISPVSMKRILTGTPAPGRGVEKKRELISDKRQKIFQAAVQVFSKEGFHKATIDMVAAQSGVGKGSIYRYFKSKEDLLSQLLQEKYTEIIVNLKQIFTRERDVIGQIQMMIEFWVAFIEDNYDVYRLIQSEAIAQQNGDIRMFYDYIITHLPMMKERIVALNIEKKIKTTSFYSVFYGIFGFIDGIVYKWSRNGRSYPLRDEIPVILEVLFNGFVEKNLPARASSLSSTGHNTGYQQSPAQEY